MKTAVKGFEHDSQGYSLVELLLTTSLLLLFAGLGVLSLRGPGEGPNLDEGAIRFEGLLRYARAEAANSGHRVRVSFVPMTGTNQPLTASSNALQEVQVTWEANPYDEPDVFETFPTPEWGVDQLNETVGVQSIRQTGQPVVEPQPYDDGEDGVVVEEEPNPEPELGPTSITFNPDGSSDSAEIILAARGVEDSRRVTMRVEGLTGTISRLSEEKVTDEEAEPVPDHLQADQQAGAVQVK